LAALPLGLFIFRQQPSAAAGLDESIPQPASADPAHYVERAFAMQRLAAETGDQAYGAVIVKDNRVVGQAPSRVVVNRDPTAHAEMEAIRDAARRLGTRDLSNCVMYSSSRPCPMCEAAAYWAHVEKLVHGTGATIGGSPRLTRC
jgi:tRNA(Arg) A34 adenosine deaminase TadA